MKKKLLIAVMGVILLTGCGKSIENESEKVYTIDKEDALGLVKEALSDESYSAEYLKEYSSEGEESYYIFNIKKGDEILKQQLAVDMVSGELYTYQDGEISGYSEFSDYNSDADDSIQWTGEYSSGEHLLTIEEAEPGSFEYHFDGEAGFAMFDTRSKAASDFKDEHISFEYSAEGITVTGSTDFDGVYVK